MGVIKTALEIALEKTANVSSDRTSIIQFEAEQKGKKLANTFLADSLDLAAELKKAAAEEKGSSLQAIKQGVFEVFISQIALPSTQEDLEKNDKLGKGFSVIIKSNKVSSFFNELAQIYTQYLQEAAQYEKMVHQQYAPKLRQKEEELSRRFGREVKIDPLQDPEFVNILNQHVNALKNNYEPVIEQAKEEIKKMWND
ncbi:MAG: hypothetical protein FWC22_01310 [Treponema sp.]|nr:hypothetical protein [Treponema sp.]